MVPLLHTLCGFLVLVNINFSIRHLLLVQEPLRNPAIPTPGCGIQGNSWWHRSPPSLAITSSPMFASVMAQRSYRRGVCRCTLIARYGEAPYEGAGQRQGCHYRMAIPIMQKGKLNSMRSRRTMAEGNYPNGDLLVSASWLAQHLHDPNMKIVDARSAQDYTAGHVPGAVLLPNGAFRSTRGVPDACTPGELPATAGARGGRAQDTVVCYDGTGGARTWWVFARFGHRNVRFLNGGFRQWTAGGHPTSTEAVQPHPTTYQLGEVQDHLACSL